MQKWLRSGREAGNLFGVALACFLYRKQAKATPNKFPASRPDLNHFCMQVGSPFPLFHYKIGSFYSRYLPGTAAQKLLEPVKSCIKAYSFLSNNKNITQT